MLAPTGPLKLKLHLFRQVCRGRIYASRAVYPLYRIIGTAAAGGIYAAPTSQPILFILVYGRGRGVPRPYILYITKQVLFSFPPLPLHILKMRSPFFLFFFKKFSRNTLFSPLPCHKLPIKKDPQIHCESFSVTIIASVTPAARDCAAAAPRFDTDSF